MGRIKICGKKPTLVFSRGVADDIEHSIPVFGNSLAGRGSFGKSDAMKRERLFAAELWLSARHSDFVVGDATSNVFLMLLESIAGRKRVADIPRPVRLDEELFSSAASPDDNDNGDSDGGGGGGGGIGKEKTVQRCPSFNAILNECLWISSLGASFQTGWHSVLLNNPWVNGEPRIVEYAMRIGQDEMARRRDEANA